MSTIKENVEKLLEELKPLRDDDKKLEWAYWIRYDGISNKSQITWDEYSRVTPSATIRRARRQCQEEREDLRGSTWVQEGRRAKESTKGEFINEEIPLMNVPNLEAETVEVPVVYKSKEEIKKDYKSEIDRIREESIYKPKTVKKWGNETFIKNGDVSDI